MPLNLATFNIMEIATFTEISKNFLAAMDRVVDDCTPIAITQRLGKPAVMLSLDDWNFIQSKVGGELTHIGD
jgi:PHD/YefM family antitoxin component YafN of YafNO toxin-antitoxin module